MSWSAQEVEAYVEQHFAAAETASTNPGVSRAAEALRSVLSAYDAAPAPSKFADDLRRRAAEGDRQALWASIAAAVLPGDHAFGAGYFKRLSQAGDFEPDAAIDAARFVFEQTSSPTESILASLFGEIDKIDEGIAALEKRDDPFSRRALRTLRRANR